MLEAKILKMENETAVLGFLDGQKITVPLAVIEGDPTEGQRIFVLFASPGSESGANQKLAKFLLNELINS
jgi:hypothetical protein